MSFFIAGAYEFALQKYNVDLLVTLFAHVTRILQSCFSALLKFIPFFTQFTLIFWGEFLAKFDFARYERVMMENSFLFTDNSHNCAKIRALLLVLSLKPIHTLEKNGNV